MYKKLLNSNSPYILYIFTFVVFLLLSVINCISEEIKDKTQSNTNVEKLNKLSKQFAEQYNKNKERALKLAKKNGWTVRKEFDNGKIIELQGVDETGHPIYYTTFEDNTVQGDTNKDKPIKPIKERGDSCNGKNVKQH